METYKIKSYSAGDALKKTVVGREMSSRSKYIAKKYYVWVYSQYSRFIFKFCI